MLLNVEHLYKYFNGQALLKDINFTVEDREAVGLIGINGCGKSTPVSYTHLTLPTIA